MTDKAPPPEGVGVDMRRYRKPSEMMGWIGAEAAVPPQMVAQTFEVVVSSGKRSIADVLGPELYQEHLAARAARRGGPQQE